jgi:hypothetical protein
MSMTTDSCYRTDTIYEETDGFFFVVDGKKFWFDSVQDAKQESGLTRVFTLYYRNGRKHK